MWQKTKIVATVGPASQSLDCISDFYKNGVCFLRLNMSHGDFDTHLKTINLRDEFEKDSGKILGLIFDLCGPKIRIGDFKDGFIDLKKDAKFILTTKKVLGDEFRVHINYPNLTKDISVGNKIMLDDGKKLLVVTQIISETDIETKVVFGGNLTSRRGVNMPDAELSISALTKKDKKDIDFAIKKGADYFALSFVRSKNDVLELRKYLTKNNSNAKIISKIETPEALKNIDDIIDISDGIMVARGDLAIEIGAENVPYIQKQIITKCNIFGKPVITATQMLESMVRNPVPTRAEVSDVANAIVDGTDAVMLSEETAIGAYPKEAVRMMSRTAIRMEQEIKTHKRINVRDSDLVDSVSSSIVHVAEDIKAKLIVALTESGFTPRVISRHRPVQSIISITPHLLIARQSMLSYGVCPIFTQKYSGLSIATSHVIKELTKRKLIKKGESMVLSAGLPFGQPGSTNTMVVMKI